MTYISNAGEMALDITNSHITQLTNTVILATYIEVWLLLGEGPALPIPPPTNKRWLIL